MKRLIFTLSLIFLQLTVFAKPQKVRRPQAYHVACSSEKRVLLSAVGDILLHDRLQRQALKQSDKHRTAWKDMEPWIQSADIAYANLEGPVAENMNLKNQDVPDVGFSFDDIVYSGFPRFNYHPQIIQDLVAAGFDIVSIANNHAMDRGPRGIDKTINNLTTLGLKFSGAKLMATPIANKDNFYTIIERKNYRLAFVACAHSLNGFKDPHEQVLKCYDNESYLLALVKRLSEDPSIHAVIVTPHWGDEGKLSPHRWQKKLALALADAGATAVIGTHPHVLQPLEFVNSKYGREVPIVYSTGNFISSQPWTPNRTSGMFFFELVEGVNKKLVVRNIKMLPLWMSRTSILTVKPILDISKSGPEPQTIWNQTASSALHINSDSAILNKCFEDQ